VVLVAAYGCTSSGAGGGGDDGGPPSDGAGGHDSSVREGGAADGASGDVATGGDGMGGGMDSSSDVTADSGSADGDGCSSVATACSLSTDAGTINGLFSCGTCAPCIDPDDDLACTTAYGGASDGGPDGGPAPYICNGGTCTPGNCHADSDCQPSGFICGVKTAFMCGPCTSDSDCKKDSDYQGQGLTVCTIAMGTCGPIDCNQNDGTPCAQNPADVCCSQTCAPGNCCTDAQCSGATPHCVKNQCGP
jgi:hypothetical protein